MSAKLLLWSYTVVSAASPGVGQCEGAERKLLLYLYANFQEEMVLAAIQGE